MISCSKCKKANLPIDAGGCIKTGGIVDIGCEYGELRNPTNADRIRAMSDEDLAKKISGIESFALTCGAPWPPEKWIEWLQQEAKE